MTPRLVRRLTLALAVVYAALGTLEVVLKVAEGSAVATIGFFGGTLLSGAGLILCGLFAHVSDTIRRVLAILGAAVGLLASAWTLVVPILAITVMGGNVVRPAVPRTEADQP
ncbi:hypothetical protein [Nocardioides sp.]|uniref:hypothetical protein n=1 Tax=Nocardioides sp. TaxID=35761 RepID=UPI00286E5D1A|nr:hypothetical protein [Nocardioides sp.]